MGEQLQQRLGEWVARDLLEPAQADRILAFEQARADAAVASPDGPEEIRLRAPGWRAPIVAEAVGYLGAVLTVVAGSLVIGEFWDQIAPWGRITLTALLTVVVFAAGWVLRARTHPAVQRLTSLLWFAATAGVAFTAGLSADQADVEGRAMALIVTAAILLAAGGLYAMRRTPLQLLGLGIGVMGTAIALLAYPRASVEISYYALLVWGVGTAWTVLALTGWLRPRAPAVVLGLLAAGIGCQIGSSGVHGDTAVIGALVMAGLLIWLSTRLDDTLVLTFGVGGVFVFVPQAVFRFFGDSIGAPLALLLTGLLLVAAAVGMITLRREIGEEVGT